MHSRKRSCGHKTLNLLISAFLLALIQTSTYAGAELEAKPSAANFTENPQFHAELLQRAFVAAAEKVEASVVRISANVRKSKSDETDGKVLSRGSGSGFFIDSNGHILTNNHVVDPGGNIDVFTTDLRRYKATVVGRDVKTDLAVIKIAKTGDGELPPVVKFGDSDLIKAGQWSLAVGAPYGLERSISIGIISGVGRSNMGVADFENYIQTDAAINPGNSGGPLVNLNGEVIGVVAARLGKSGIGFAIPVNMVRQVADHLIKNGKVVRGYMGVKIQGLNFEMAQKFGLASTTGALVADIKSGGPADAAGLKRGDVVIEFNGAGVKDAKDFQLKTSFTSPGKMATVKVIRDHKRLDLSVKIGELVEDGTSDLAVEKTSLKYGLNAKPMSLKEIEYEDDQDVALIVSSVERGSRAELDGLKSGDIILEIEREKVDCMSHFKRAMEKIKNGKNQLALVLRDGATFYTILRAP